MKNISQALRNHLSAEVTSMATCWKLTRVDGTVYGFTDHDKDIFLENVNYLSSSGFTRSAVANSGSLSVDNLEVDGILNSNHISERDLIGGLYDFAEVEIFRVNYQDLTQGKVSIKTGWIGNIKFNNGSFNAEIRGLTQRLSQKIGEIYSPNCRANLGDHRCKINLTGYTVRGEITKVTNNREFSASGIIRQNNYFSYGRIEFLSGLNKGILGEIKRYSNGDFILMIPVAHRINLGDLIEVIAGCDKKIATCIDRFSNVVNFRGEPHLPGIDSLIAGFTGDSK